MIAIEDLVLKEGRHGSREEGVCLLEAVAWVAGEPHSDHPACVCPVLAEFGRSWNDTLNEADRNRLLKPLIPLLVGTAGSAALSERRAVAIIDWFVREWLPLWLALTPALESAAQDLRSLPEIRTWADLDAAQPRLKAAARSADAARDAARPAALAAALAAGRAAARAAARDVAWTVARTVAWGAWDRLAPVVAASQLSAVAMLKRLCKMKETVE